MVRLAVLAAAMRSGGLVVGPDQSFFIAVVAGRRVPLNTNPRPFFFFWRPTVRNSIEPMRRWSSPLRLTTFPIIRLPLVRTRTVIPFFILGRRVMIETCTLLLLLFSRRRSGCSSTPTLKRAGSCPANVSTPTDTEGATGIEPATTTLAT